MPTLEHEAPLALLRESPDLIATLLRESLGIDVPPYDAAEVVSADLTQVRPFELRADLVVNLRAGPARRVVWGIIVEVQRAIDDDKRRAWPLYSAALLARNRCQTCLVVLATTEAVARWAAEPILWCLNGPYVPLVIGPGKVPRVSAERAGEEPWLAMLSGLMHGNHSEAAVRAAVAGLRSLSDEQADLCYDLLQRSLNEVMRLVMENQMSIEHYEFKGPTFLRRIAEAEQRAAVEGERQGTLKASRAIVAKLAARHGPVRDELRARVEACAELEALQALALDLADAADREAVEALLARLPAGHEG